MKHNLTTTLSLLFLLILLPLAAQKKDIEKANAYFEEHAFTEAILFYETLIKKGNTDTELFKKLGHSYYLNANYEKALEWYEKTHEEDNYKNDPELLYRYAQALKSLRRYEESDELMKKLSKIVPKDIRVLKYEKNIEYLKKIKEAIKKYDIHSININSSLSDFAPTYYMNNLVFVSERKGKAVYSKTHDWNGKRFLDLWTSKLSDTNRLSGAKKFSKKINTSVHESSAVFTASGDTIYFTRNNSKKGRFLRGIEGVSHLKIYRSVLKKGKWQKPKPLPFNGEDYSVAHPTLNKEGKIMYFSSNMAGSYGQSDIYKVMIHADGSFGTPENMGPEINTESRETFPFISTSNELYFASDGHAGLGGLDIFKAQNQEGTMVIHNLGEPINSVLDDFSFIADSTGTKGYFASNRKGGVGSDDIYAYTLTHTKKERSIEIETEMERDVDTISIVSHTENARQKQDIGMPPVSLKKSGLDVIHFGFDAFKIEDEEEQILKKITTFLVHNPNLKLKIETHTDIRGSEAYNKYLSEKRLQAITTYFKQYGIAAYRLVGETYGESKLRNKCIPDIICSEQTHAENRRAEFYFIE